jgi:hypothetical protein
MKNVLCNSLIALAFVVSSSFAARLEVAEKAQQHVKELKAKKVSKQIDVSNQSILEKEEVTGRPVVLEVIKAKEDNSLKQRFSKVVPLPEKIVFNAARGAYSYNDVDLQQAALNATDKQSLGSLRAKANAILEQLLGKKDAGRFVFANEETDYVKENDGENPRILKKTYRYTRKVNGRHILDNTSFVRVSFSGNQELSGFEIVNPELKPVKAVERLVKLDATDKRLQQYAEKKDTAVRNGPKGKEMVGVEVIKAKAGFDTYLAKKVGDKVLLIPNTSFYAEYHLENGERFENWSHFGLDADYVQNLDDDMIEGNNR